MSSSANTTASVPTGFPYVTLAFQRLCWKEARQIAPLAIALLAINTVLHLLPVSSSEAEVRGLHILLLNLMPCLFASGAALRQFKHQEGHWPTRLSELEKVGLTPTNYSTVNRGVLSYEVTDGVAYLWGSDLVGDSPVASARTFGELDSSTNGQKLVTLQ
jgi:hypothetical protein